MRVTHWLVALGVVTDLFNETGFTHRLIGYACLLLVLWRIGHGLGSHAPASSTFYWPSLQAIRQHIVALKNKNTAVHAGHNPLGQWAVYLIWALIGLLAFTGC